MGEPLKPDLCVIGAGSGGLSVAAGAAQLGARVVLIEKAEMGGDCLNYGCVPSKAMLAAAKRAHAMRHPQAFGIAGVEPEIDPRKVHRHIHGVIAAIAPNDSEERFTGMGVRVIRARARFTDRETVEADGQAIRARRFVVAAGSAPAVPAIPGIDKVPRFTNETIFDNRRKVSHLLVIGGGPVGLELAQAHRRLGSAVTVLEAAAPLGREDPELAAVLLKRLEAEGVEIAAGARVEKLERSRSGVRAYIAGDESADEDAYGARAIEASHLLVAAGRAPNLDGLDLDKAGIRYDETGIRVTNALKTTNKRVYAIGDVAAGEPRFTHMANHHAGLVIRNALFRLPVRVSREAIPRVTYTDPELAYVGLSEEQARRRHGRIAVLRWPYAENDRAQAERETDGFVKVVTDKRGRILGAGIVGAHAGDLIQTWVLAITRKMKIGDLTSTVVAYPTLAEINRRVAYSWYLPRLTNAWMRRIIRFVRVFG